MPFSLISIYCTPSLACSDLVFHLLTLQRNFTSLISSMDHITIGGLTLEITSVNMQAMIVTTACMYLCS